MWHIHHGKWWMIQWQLDWWLSLGVHIDLKRRTHAQLGVPFGPYIDLHVGPFLLSVGRNCYFAHDPDVHGRGGVG